MSKSGTEETSGTRIEVTTELNQLLDKEVQRLKENGVKGASKKNILTQLVKAGLDYQQVSQNANNTLDLTDSLGISHPPINRPHEYIIEPKSELKARQEALLEKEDRLIVKEKHLNDREDRVNKMYLDAISLREKASDMQINIKNIVGDQSMKEYKISHLEGQVKDLNRENKQLNRELLKLIKEINRNTQPNVFKDYIIPSLAPVMLAYEMINSQNKSNKEVPPGQKLSEINPSQNTNQGIGISKSGKKGESKEG